MITDGQNGHLLPLAAQGRDYAEVIADSFANPARYSRLCHRSYETFEQALNWKVFTRRFLQLASERCHLFGRSHARDGRSRHAAPLLNA